MPTSDLRDRMDKTIDELSRVQWTDANRPIASQFLSMIVEAKNALAAKDAEIERLRGVIRDAAFEIRNGPKQWALDKLDTALAPQKGDTDAE